MKRVTAQRYARAADAETAMTGYEGRAPGQPMAPTTPLALSYSPLSRRGVQPTAKAATAGTPSAS